MKEPKELLLEMIKSGEADWLKEVILEMIKTDEPNWLNNRKIEVTDVAKAMHCNPKILYDFAQDGKCPFIDASKKEDGTNVSYLVWPGKAEEYIGQKRLQKAMEERENAV